MPPDAPPPPPPPPAPKLDDRIGGKRKFAELTWREAGAQQPAWLKRLATLRAELEAQAAARDAEADAAMGLRTETETLAAAERAWDAFREAECAWRYARWGAGTMRQLAGAACRRDLAAARVLDLREVLAGAP